MMLFAFDRDETTTTSNGPVSIELVSKLKEKNLVVGIGNQALCDEASIPGTGGGNKPTVLRLLKTTFPNMDRYIVIDDDPVANIDGWEYFTPGQFVEEW